MNTNIILSSSKAKLNIAFPSLYTFLLRRETRLITKIRVKYFYNNYFLPTFHRKRRIFLRRYIYEFVEISSKLYARILEYEINLKAASLINQRPIRIFSRGAGSFSYLHGAGNIVLVRTDKPPKL